MKVSMGIALPLFAQSEGELVDIEIYDNLNEEEIKEIKMVFYCIYYILKIRNAGTNK